MSNASRPTYFPAVGRPDNGGVKSGYSSAKDQAAHTTLKYRQAGQASGAEVKQKDFRAELAQKEQKYLLEKDKTTAWMAKEESKVNVPLLLKETAEAVQDDELHKTYDDEDVELNNNDSDGFDSSSEEDDDEDDDEDELQAELERIREERAAAAARRAAEERELEDKMQKDQSLRSNPLTPFGDAGSAKVSPLICSSPLLPSPS